MSQQHLHIAEAAAVKAFTRQATVFDKLYSSDTIIQYKRESVRSHVEDFLLPQSRILELNAGTGEDAIYFASKGHHVHATDASTGMQASLKEKVSNADLSENITQELISFTELDQLKSKSPYDLIFSNFAGLNCTQQLDKVLASLPPLVKTGGHITLVILPKFCLWEFMLLFRGKIRTALRRFSGSKGARAHVEGQYFRCWYYSPSYVISRMKKDFDLVSIEGLCTWVPPSYMEGFAEKHPRLYKFLVTQEAKRRKTWPWRTIGDYYILSMKKR